MHTHNRSSLVFAVLAAAFLFASLLASHQVEAGKSMVFTGIVKGVAVGGYDPVAYFAIGKPLKGNKEIVAEKDGVVWRFSSQENRAAFLADPEKFAPRYGGYCAWAVGQGYTAKGDPQAWKIVDGKLYLNYDHDVQETWSRNIPANISNADANWPKVLN
ncbi:MAG: YHS domain protein [Alphaproteobacteria bacterium]|nr:YHS domain protein [Alphaproteobacteria bacterium]